jgi:hypothetical protein
MTKIWDHYEGSPEELLLLLAMADFANDDGGNIWASNETYAKKSRRSVRTVQRQVKKLIQEGWIQATGSHPFHNTNLYQINIQKLSQLELLTAEPSDTHVAGDNLSPMTNEAERGDKGDTLTVSLDPSVRLLPNYTKPEWWNEDSWQEWITHRKELRKKITKSMANKLVVIIEKLVAEGHDMKAIIDWNIGQGNQGIYPPRGNQNGNNDRQTSGKGEKFNVGEYLRESIKQQEGGEPKQPEFTGRTIDH